MLRHKQRHPKSRFFLVLKKSRNHIEIKKNVLMPIMNIFATIRTTNNIRTSCAVKEAELSKGKYNCIRDIDSMPHATIEKGY